MLGLLHRVRAPGKVKVGACALSARTFITSEHGSDARLRNNVQIIMLLCYVKQGLPLPGYFVWLEVLFDPFPCPKPAKPA